jgi:hypothetical protein
LTHFEKNVMRRVIPFFMFSRKNIPLQANRLASTPGSVASQLPVLAAGQHDNANPLPDSLSGGLTVPLGSVGVGKHCYLTDFGTPLEEALGRIPFKDGLPDLRGSGLSVTAGLNPIVKAPLEALADLEFFSGRRLFDIKPSATASTLGRLVGDGNPTTHSHVLANTPPARFITSLDRLVEDRKSSAAKALALATGLRLTDVDLEKARLGDESQTRDSILARMPLLRASTNYSVRLGEKLKLTPDEIALLRSVADARQKSRDRAKAPMRIGFRRTGE